MGILHFDMKGFTLVEILFATSILLLLGTMGVGVLGDFQRSVALDAAAGDVASLLESARARTLSSEGGMQHGIYFEQGSVTLFRGDTYDPADDSNEVVLMPPGIEISSITLQGGGDNVIFNRLTGETDQYGSVVVRIASNPAKIRTITIEPTGISGVE